MSSPGSPKSLPLILAREFAVEPRHADVPASTPAGMLVFYNDAAALLLGKPFAELGEIPAGEFAAVARARHADGRVAAAAQLPRRHRVLPATAVARVGRRDHLRRRAAPVRGDRVPAVRDDRRHARRDRRVLGGRRRGRHRLMRARIWGCRGSLAAPGADTVRYGGNTSCVEVRLDSGHVIVLDAGTGMRPLGVQMQHDLPARAPHPPHPPAPRPPPGPRLLPPAVRARPRDPDLGPDVAGAGPRGAHRASTCRRRSSRCTSTTSRPSITFHDAPEVAVTIGSATVRAGKVTHQGPTVGYRIEEHGRAFVYLPDHEPSIGNDLSTVSPDWMSGYDLARDADVLLHDAQYHDHEYGAHVGWGHSSITDTMEFATKAGVERVVLFHHDPYHDDDDLEELLVEARAKWPGADERRAARVRADDDHARRDRGAGARGRRALSVTGQDPDADVASAASVARMMWPTKGRISVQYRRNDRRLSASGTAVRHSSGGQGPPFAVAPAGSGSGPGVEGPAQSDVRLGLPRARRPARRARAGPRPAAGDAATVAGPLHEVRAHPPRRAHR